MSRREDDPTVEDIESEEESSDESSDEDTPDEPATPSITNQSLPEVTSQLDDLHLEMSDNNTPRGRPQTPAPTGERTAMPGGAATRVNPPMEFTGRRDQIKSFRLQCKLYWEMNPDKFSNNQRNKLLFAMSYLRGKALDWIQPHMEDFIDHPTGAGANARTLELLRNDAVFFEALKETFDVGNDTLEADRDLRALRQKTSAAAYRAEFSILAAKVGWNDDALASQFYRGLKEQVRVEITMRHERPSTLKDMADLAIRIDTRIFEVQLEKKGSYFQGRPNTKAQRDVPAWKDDYYGLQKMQIDATKGKPGSNKGPTKGQDKRPQPKTKGTTDKSSVECYGCGKKGHYKNECNARKQRHELQGPGQSNNNNREFRATKGNEKAKSDENAKDANSARVEYNTLAATLPNRGGRGSYDTTGTENATDQDDHTMMSWTACYDDDCYIHFSDKQGSGWFPRRRSQSICFSRGGPRYMAEEVRYAAGYPVQEESSDEGQEEESSENEELEEGEVSNGNSDRENQTFRTFAYSFPTNDVTPILLRSIIQKRIEIFPFISGIQYVNEDKLSDMYDEIRRTVMGMPTIHAEVNYARIIQERPPLGSNFTQRGGYTTPEGIVICRTLRNKVRALQEDFANEATQQRAQRRVRFPDSPTLGRGSIYQQDRNARAQAQPLIESDYMDPESRPGVHRLPTPGPSQSETPTLPRRSQPQPRNAGN
jgi:hypothetical protein